MWRWRATYRWKTLDKGYNFSLDLISIGGLHKKLWASKVARIQISRISGLSTWESQDKLGVDHVAKHKEYYKGEGGGFPQVWAVVSLVSFVFACDWSVHQKCSNYALTNLLFSLCKSTWIIDLLVTHSSPHLGALAHPSTPGMLWTKERAPTLYPFVVFTLDSHLNLSRSLGVCQSPTFNYLNRGSRSSW